MDESGGNSRGNGRDGSEKPAITLFGDTVGVFQELARLEQEGDHAAIIELATKQIERTPSWLTPYLSRGVAYANIGELHKAIADLQHVVETAAGDPTYERAGMVLQQLLHLKE